MGSNPLNWHKTTGWFSGHARALQAGVRALTRLRTTHPALREAAVELPEDGLPEDVAVVVRGGGDESVVLAGNFGRQRRRVAVPLAAEGAWRDVIGGQPAVRGADGTAVVELESGGVAVFAIGG